MPRAIRLPPLIRENGTETIGVENSINENFDQKNIHNRRQSVLSSSDAKIDRLAIDFILVYSLNHNDDDSKNNNQTNFSRSELRKRFEEYLVKKQGLILEHHEPHASKYGYVRVHTPFEILLLTAENTRMKLPIEKIKKNDNDDDDDNKTRWHRFTTWYKKPFRLDKLLEKDDPDYYTAIYSSRIVKFKELFEGLRGSKDLYFTSSERSLLTHELLSRGPVHDDEYDNDQQSPVVRRPALNTDVESTSDNRLNILGTDRLRVKQAYDCYFPLHVPLRDNLKDVHHKDLNDREKLQKYWTNWRRCLKFQPLSLIRSYMGEKMAFYFALFGFYNQMLIAPALVGLIIFIYGISSVFTDQPTSDICGDFGQSTNMCPICDISCPFWKLSDSCVYSKIAYVFDNTATIVFAVFMSLWARCFVEFWKRREAVLQYEWDSIDFEGRLEPTRPQFEAEAKKIGKPRINPVTGLKERHISIRKRVPFYLIATAVVLFAMAIVCATLFCTIVYRIQMNYILKTTSVKTYSSIIITVTSAVMNLICSVTLSQFYYWIAKKLTDLELHKFQSAYDDAFTIKIYLFQFVSFYSSLFYIAFFKGRFIQYPSKYGDGSSGDFTEQCDPAGCIVELTIQLIIIMIGQQIIKLILQFFSAMRCSCISACCNHTKNDGEQWEKDKELIDFTSSTLIDEYLALVIQFGFVTLFVVAFPLAPLFALINNIIELRLDAWKFLSKYKRFIPFKASDIGIWRDIISALSYLAVLTNAVIIAWTSEFIPKLAYHILEPTGTNLNGYVNWTLSSFSILDYNLTGTMPPNVPAGLTYCRYRDFRSTTAPYSETSTYWNVLAARLAFIVVFENMIFFIIYILQWLVPDVPRHIQDKIDHERYIDQCERWTSQTSQNKCEHTVDESKKLRESARIPNRDTESPNRPDTKSLTRQPNRKGFGVKISPEYEQ